MSPFKLAQFSCALKIVDRPSVSRVLILVALLLDNMEFNFQGKKALVTGAGKGIGRGIAEELWKGGATVYALSRTQSDLDSLQADFPGMQIVCVDLQDWNATQKAVVAIGDVDLLVNNAGVLIPTSVLDSPENAYNTIIDINVKAVVNVTQIVGKGMVARRCGAIVNISSLAAKFHIESEYIYGAAKAALDQLTRCQAVELGPHQVRVNAIIPTATKTAMVEKFIAENDAGLVQDIINRAPIHRIAEVKDIVDATLYLLSDKADMINGAILPVDGGFWCT